MEENKQNDFSAYDKYYKEEFEKIQNSDEVYKGRFNMAGFIMQPLWLLAKGLLIEAALTIAAYILFYFIWTLAILPMFPNVTPFYTRIFFILIWIITGTIIGGKGNYLYYKNITKKK